MPVRDTLKRPLRDLRISVTDRCNFRCPYCMPREVFGPGYPFLRDPQLMTLGELTRIARAFTALGVEKIRLTGGEPLLRPDVPELVRTLKHTLRVPDVALTTNGWLLEKSAPALKAAGLDRINVSVDSLNEETAGRLNGLGFSTSRVLRGIDAAAAQGLPVKINCVLQRGVNDSEILALAAYFRERGHTLRFIEFMDVGTLNRWSRERVVPGDVVLERLRKLGTLEPLSKKHPGETSDNWAWSEGRGTVGLISSVTRPFCGDCSRARLGADGRLYTCLFSAAGHDLKTLLRSGAGVEEISTKLKAIWTGRSDRYSELRTDGRVKKVEMFAVGG